MLGNDWVPQGWNLPEADANITERKRRCVQSDNTKKGCVWVGGVLGCWNINHIHIDFFILLIMQQRKMAFERGENGGEGCSIG